MIIRNLEAEPALPAQSEASFPQRAAIEPAPQLPAVSNWTLQRWRKPKLASAAQHEFVKRVISRANPSSVSLGFQGRTTHVRPTAARLLKFICLKEGQVQPLGDVCHALYGRPSTLRSVRQVVFRVNRALERVDCPLVVRCQSLHIFVEPKLPAFQRTPAAITA